jgi:hypothetical protein
MPGLSAASVCKTPLRLRAERPIPTSIERSSPLTTPTEAVHIHFKIRTEPEAASGLEFTSQLFFDDGLTDVVHARDPYVGKGQRDRRNEDDDIFGQSGGQMTLTPVEAGDGYAATFFIGVVA